MHIAKAKAYVNSNIILISIYVRAFACTHTNPIEYGLEGRVSTKGDVYSYGIVLMETFTRTRPTDEMFTGGLSLRQWVSCSFPHHVMKVVDANLLTREENFAETTKENLQSCLLSIMELALLCSRDLPEERLSMKDVVAKLMKIKRQYVLAVN